MKIKSKYLLSLLIILLIISCRSGMDGQHTSRPLNLNYFAWNEDTAKLYQFALFDNRHFSYRLPHPENDSMGIMLRGVVLRDKDDTLFLGFKEGTPPPLHAGYLIREVSGNYLVQTFGDDRKRVYLRIQYPFDRGHAP